MKFAVRRILWTLVVLWGVCSMTFLLLHMTPGDPVELMMRQAPQADIEAARHALGLDQSLSSQYFHFLKRLAHGDLGLSFSTRKTVSSEILEALPGTLMLAVTSMAFAIAVGIPLGVMAAARRNTWLDSVAEGFGLVGLSMPNFWLAPLLIIFFSIKLDILPVNGMDSWDAAILPTVSLGLGLSAVLLRMTRAAVLEVLDEEYIRVARAKGLTEYRVFFKHALKNAFTPIVTILSLQFGAVLTGLVITETIFDWPGLGVLLFNGLQSRDYPLVQGCVLAIAFIYVVVNLVTEFAYIAVNPRLRQA